MSTFDIEPVLNFLLNYQIGFMTEIFLSKFISDIYKLFNFNQRMKYNFIRLLLHILYLGITF